MNDPIIGRQISKFRKAAEMTQEELGEAVGISSQAVSRWECGGAPDIALLPAIADKLGVTVDALFGRDGSECADIEDVVGGWLCSVPKKERLDRLCRLVWSSVKYLLEDGLGIPEMGYLETCHPDMGDGLNRRKVMPLGSHRKKNTAVCLEFCPDKAVWNYWNISIAGNAVTL